MSGKTCSMPHDCMQGFPLSMHDVLPLLSVIGTANKHLAKVGGFMSRCVSVGSSTLCILPPTYMSSCAGCVHEQVCGLE
jgi:hypothetical protein